ATLLGRSISWKTEISVGSASMAEPKSAPTGRLVSPTHSENDRLKQNRPGLSKPDLPIHSREKFLFFAGIFRLLAAPSRAGVIQITNNKRQQSHLSCPFNCASNHALLLCRVSGLAARHNLASIR